MVWDCDYEEAYVATEQLENLSRLVDVVSTIRLMKQTVPEFVSRNSRFCEIDNVK